MEPPSKINETISTQAAKAFYDRLGSRHDWFEFYEGEAKRIGLEKLDLSPGSWVPAFKRALKDPWEGKLSCELIDINVSVAEVLCAGGDPESDKEARASSTLSLLDK